MDLTRTRQGFTVFLTGLSGAGKSTTAAALLEQLLQRGDRHAILLDGDSVRKHVSPALGFSKTDRDLNIRRIGLMASEVNKSGGIAICAAIAPYDRTRKDVRALIDGSGSRFVLVHMATPLTICEQRDTKGLYAKARAGALEHFTGISDPYEIPADAELIIDTTSIAPEEAAQRVTDYLEREGDAPSTQSSRRSPELTQPVKLEMSEGLPAAVTARAATNCHC